MIFLIIDSATAIPDSKRRFAETRRPYMDHFAGYFLYFIYISFPSFLSLIFFGKLDDVRFSYSTQIGVGQYYTRITRVYYNTSSNRRGHEYRARLDVFLALRRFCIFLSRWAFSVTATLPTSVVSYYCYTSVTYEHRK